LQFSPDGERISARYFGFRIEWDAHTGVVLSSKSYQDERNGIVSWSPNGVDILNHFYESGSNQPQDEVMNADKPDQVVSLPNFYGPGAFSPDGHYLAYVDLDGRLRLRDLVIAGEKLLANHYNWDYQTAEFNAAGDLMLVRYHTRADKYGAVLWNLTTLTQRAVLREPIIFTPGGGSLAVGNEGGSVSILDGFTLHETQRFSTGYGSPVISLAFSPDGQQLAGGDTDGHIALWDVQTGAVRSIIAQNEIYKQISGLWFSPDGSVLASWNGGAYTVEVWDMTTLERRFQSGGLMNFGMVSFSPDSRYLLVGGIKMLGASYSGVAHIHDLQTGQELASPGGVYLAGEMPDVKPDRIVHYYEPHNPHWTFVDQARWFPGSNALLTISHDAVRMWDLPTLFEYGIGVKVAQVEGVDEQIYGFSPPGAGRMTDGGRTGGIGDVVFSPTQSLLVFSDNQDEIQFWDISDPRHVQVNKLPDKNWYDFVFSTDGSFLLGVTNKQYYRLWDAHTRAAQAVNVPALSALKDEPLNSWVRSFQFTPDGTRLIVLCGDAVRILQVQ
jgi:WD40 repeat protein